MKDRWKDQVRKRKGKRDRGRRIIRIEDSERKCRGMRMDRLEGGGRLNRRVVLDRGITA